jgi:hypothetical protein
VFAILSFKQVIISSEIKLNNMTNLSNGKVTIPQVTEIAVNSVPITQLAQTASSAALMAKIRLRPKH